MNGPGIQNLSSDTLDNQGICVATEFSANPVPLDGDGDDFIEFTIKWSNGKETDLAIETSAANSLISALSQALLKLPPHHATISLADLTGVRIDAAAEIISVDGISGTGSGSDWPDWKLDDRRSHVYGGWSCHHTHDCTACSA